MTCNSIYSPLEVNELELYIQDLISATENPISKKKLKKIYDGLLYIGQTYGHLDECFIGQKELTKLFGERSSLNDIHKKIIHQCIRRIHKGNNLDKKGFSQYYMTEDLLEMTKNHLLSQVFKLKGVNKMGDINIQLNLPIKSLNDALNLVHINDDNNDLKKCIRNLNSISKFYEFGKDNNPNIDFNIPYFNGDEGRLHSIFTYMSKELRNEYFIDWYDYDIEASMPTIISQAAKAHYLFETPHIQNYINDKTEIRQKMATKLNLSLSKIKQLYNMPFFGAAFPTIKQAQNPFINKKSRAMLDLVGLKNIQLLDDDVEWHNYNKEINQLKKLFNNNIWDIYFKIERLILDEIMNQMGFNNIVPIHDGFISKSKINTNQLEEVIKCKTGIEIKIEEKQIKKGNYIK